MDSTRFVDVVVVFRRGSMFRSATAGEFWSDVGFERLRLFDGGLLVGVEALFFWARLYWNGDKDVFKVWCLWRLGIFFYWKWWMVGGGEVEKLKRRTWRGCDKGEEEWLKYVLVPIKYNSFVFGPWNLMLMREENVSCVMCRSCVSTNVTFFLPSTFNGSKLTSRTKNRRWENNFLFSFPNIPLFIYWTILNISFLHSGRKQNCKVKWMHKYVQKIELNNIFLVSPKTPKHKKKSVTFKPRNTLLKSRLYQLLRISPSGRDLIPFKHVVMSQSPA